MRRRYLFSYDVSDDKRRDRIFKNLRDHGDHAQFREIACPGKALSGEAAFNSNNCAPPLFVVTTA